MSVCQISPVCPECGSDTSSRLRGASKAHRICQLCRTPYVRPVPVWERLLSAAVFIISGLLIGLFSVVLFWLVANAPALPPLGLLCPVSVAALAVLAIVQAFRELCKQPQTRIAFAAEEYADEEGARATGHSPLVPPAEAKALVRAIAEKHDAKGILTRLGHFHPDHVANARAGFARKMQDDETPLVLVDQSFLRNGKKGLLVTNRALYSSYRSRPTRLSDIADVACVRPGTADIVLLNTAAFCEVVGIMLRSALLTLAGWALFFVLWFRGMRRMQNRLIVNQKMALTTGRRLRRKFWEDLLLALAAAAQDAEAAAADPIECEVESLIIHLETTVYHEAEPVTEVQACPASPRKLIEQAVRQLDGHARPSLRIWRGQPDRSPALDVLGGNGKYVLRERAENGWVYYDSNQDDEEVEVCTNGTGFRSPAFYVCTDLERVLKTIHHFIEHGTFDD